MITEHIPDTWDITPDGGSYAITDDNGKRRCGSKTVSGKPCMKSPIKGRNRCKTHNGHAPRGELAHNYQGKGYSKYASPSLRQRMESLSGTDITDLTENALLLDVRISQLVERMQGGDYGATASDLLAMWNKGSSQFRNREFELFFATYEEIGNAIRGVQGDYQTWQELIEVNKERRMLARDVHTITKGTDGMMSAVEVLDIVLKMAELFLTINSLSTERERQSQWRTGVDRIMTLPNGA